MSEKMNKALSFDRDRILQESRLLLGVTRLESLSAFSTEEHLQNVFDAFRADPGIMVINESAIEGGDEILEYNQTTLETQRQLQNTPDRVPRTTGLQQFFQIGFGLVEYIAVDYHIDQANPANITPEAYETWTDQPLEERVEEMKSYLHAQDADMLALNLFEDEQEGSIALYTKNLYVTVPRVTGEEPYHLSAKDTDAAHQITEGVLAALFLLREHQIGQNMSDAYRELAPPITPPEPPQDPPGYYLG